MPQKRGTFLTGTKDKKNLLKHSFCSNRLSEGKAPSKSSSSLTIIILLRKINTKMYCVQTYSMNMCFSESEHHYLLIVLCDHWSFTKDIRHHFLRHLLRQTLRQTQILCSYIFKEICYFRVEIPFGNSERFLADPISFAPFPLASVWGETLFFLFLSNSRMSLIRWLDEFFAAWKNRIEFVFIMSFPTFKYIVVVAFVQLNLMLFDLLNVILPTGSGPQTKNQ